MTLKLVVAVRDVKVAEYLGLVVVRTEAEAQRQFVAMLSQGLMAKFPRDFVLHQVGSVDLETGALVGLDKVRDLTPYNDVEQFEARQQAEKEKR